MACLYPQSTCKFGWALKHQTKTSITRCMSEKHWKDALLATGQPLEHTVAQIITEAGLEPPREYGYIRPNENSVPTEFSVDLHTCQIGMGSDLPFWGDYLIECKYRHDGTRWIFTPEEYRGTFGPRLKDSFVTLDVLADGHRVDRSYIETFSNVYKFCSRGCEITPKERNLVTIEQAVCQLKYAVPNLVADAIEHQLGHLLGPVAAIFVITSIIVTTAELWCLNPGSTIESIRSADNLDQIATQSDILVLYHPPDNLLQKYSTSVLKQRFSESEVAVLNESLKLNGMNSFNHYTEIIARYWPSHFVVVHYSRFRECIKNLTTFVASKRVYKAA
jgi:hypothetical protein